MTKFIIKPTISEESLESWIWTNNESVPKGFILIKNPQNSKCIKTYKRTLDENFENIYNEKNTSKINIKKFDAYLIINEFYRDVLGIEKHEEVELIISKASLFQKIFLIHWTHPNPTIQFANRATIMSIIFALIALIVTLLSICD